MRVKKLCKKKCRSQEHKVHGMSNLGGVYTGSLITYDWSGQHVVKESDLDVTIEQYGNDIRVLWKEDDIPEIEVKGLLTDTALVFTHSTYFKPNHPNRDNPVAWDFVKSELNVLKQDSVMYLSGNLKLYSPETMEPSRPLYLTLQTAVHPKAEHFANNMVKASVYPNPFRDFVNLSFDLVVVSDCSVSVYLPNGVLLYEQVLGYLSAGRHHYQLPVDIPMGKYLLTLRAGNRLINTLIIKE